MSTKTVTVADGTVYTLATITTGNAKLLVQGEDFTDSIVAASLSTGDPSKPFAVADVQALPFFGCGSELRIAALEVNGLKAQGEAGPIDQAPA